MMVTNVAKRMMTMDADVLLAAFSDACAAFENLKSKGIGNYNIAQWDAATAKRDAMWDAIIRRDDVTAPELMTAIKDAGMALYWDSRPCPYTGK